MNLNLQQAKTAIEAAKQKAVEIGVPMVIAVVDGGANLVAQERMDDALLVSLQVAANKAYTSVVMKMETADLAACTQPGTELFGLGAAAGGRLVIFGGGIPVKKGGVVVGAVGVSGGAVEEDIACAKAGMAALGKAF